jgi:hypothetical protein
MTLQAAYESGISRFAPPPMPVGRASMMKYMIAGVAIVIIGVFFIIVLLGSSNLNIDFGNGFVIDFRVIQVVITIAGIVVALVLSLLAFIRAVQGDLESQRLLPSWDRAIENWSRLRYCGRDKIVFDPQQVPPKALSDEALSALLAVEAKHEEPAQISSPMATHQ